MSNGARSSDRMGTEPVHTLLLKMSFPLMISMFVLAMYNVVDSIFVSRINENALAAVSLCFPFQNLNVAFGIGTAAGMSALLSRYLGARRYSDAEKVAHNGFILALINYSLFFVIGCLAHTIIRLQTHDAQIIDYGTVYLQLTQWLSILPMIQSMFERLLQGTGKTFPILLMQITGSIVNLIMDPILIFGLFGFPALGVKGAAIATVFGQFTGCIMGIIFNKTLNKELGLSLSKVRPHLRTMIDIYKIGIPIIVLQSVGAIMNFCINRILIGFSSTAVATFGVYFKLQSFVFMPIFGMNNGSVPIIAYNYGAGEKQRLEQAMRLGVRYGIAIMSIGTLIFWLIPEELMALFDASPEMTAMGVVALHIMSLNFPFAGYCIMRGASFQALGRSVYSMNISLVRQLVVIIPCAFLLSKIGGVNMVWWAFPIAEVAGTAMSINYYRTIKREIIEKLGNEEKVSEENVKQEE
ncbi:MAG: MATE family efflux transporter [Mogibacterium sp.]|nr:MATE family efflux transporter [Mogibacterium sp.]